jgi:hypothetical protein
MRINVTKAIVSMLLGMALIFNAFGQITPPPNEQVGRMPEKMDRSTVPPAVLDRYSIDYPSTTYESWYGYPSYEYNNGTSWYIYTPPSYTGAAVSNPEFYVVEFTADKTPYKVVYNKEGKKISTYKTSNSELPKRVINAMKKGPYKDWVVTKEKEEIWRESDKGKVYKVVVEKDNERHALYYREDGKLLKDKTK